MVSYCFDYCNKTKLKLELISFFSYFSYATRREGNQEPRQREEDYIRSERQERNKNIHGELLF